MNRWRVREVDPVTWQPGREVGCVRSVSIAKSANHDGSTPLLESATMDVTGRLTEGYYRVESLSDERGLTDVATMLFAPDDDEFGHGAWAGSASASSVLKPADDVVFKNGEYAPKGCDGAEWVASKLRETVRAPVTAHGSFTLDSHMVFDLGSSHLSGCWAVLDAAGWCIQLWGDGSVHVMEVPSEPEVALDPSSMVAPTITHSLPIADVPNVVMAYDGDQEAEAVNGDPASPTSVPSRGRRIEVAEDAPARVDGETLQQYADRRLRELSAIYETFGIEREWERGIHPYSCISMNFPEAGITGTFTVLGQQIECESDLHLAETEGRRDG